MFKNVTGGDKENYNMWPCIIYNIFDSNVLTLLYILHFIYIIFKRRVISNKNRKQYLRGLWKFNV